MLAYLRGIVQSNESTGNLIDQVVLEVSGVGFELTVASRTRELIGQIGELVTVFTSLSIRETGWTLYGFATQKERELFELLQSVNGVGPKLALSLLASLTAEQLAGAVVSQDIKLLSSTPGVGNKVAQRIALELEQKIKDWQKRFSQSPGPASGSTVRNEVQGILQELGYSFSEIASVLERTSESGNDVELLLRHSLKLLSQTRQ